MTEHEFSLIQLLGSQRGIVNGPAGFKRKRGAALYKRPGEEPKRLLMLEPKRTSVPTTKQSIKPRPLITTDASSAETLREFSKVTKQPVVAEITATTGKKQPTTSVGVKINGRSVESANNSPVNSDSPHNFLPKNAMLEQMSERHTTTDRNSVASDE